ncbi:type I restriction enzyme, S subunit [Candidatus Methanomarinus sp.]|nr:type I restriction enzyme, S subunit [ANME-2 cluster archaeon]
MKQEIKERVEKIRKGIVPEGYKKTKVGIIPNDWTLDNLKIHVSSFIVPMRDKPKVFSGDIPWCRIEDFQGKYLEKSLSNQNVSKETIDEMNLKVYPKGTVLCSCSARLGICTIVKKPLVTNQTFIGLVPNEELYNEFLYYFMGFKSEKLQKISSGTTISYLSKEEFENFPITYTSIKEQKNIISIISTWDKAIELKEKLIEEKKEFKKGLVQKLLVGKLRFKEYVKSQNLQEVRRYSTLPEEWGIKKASSIFSNISKKNNRNEKLLSATQNNGVIPRDMLNGDVMSPSGDTKSYKLVEEGDFVISLRSFQGGIEYSSYRGIISPAYTVIKNKIPICKDFYRYIFKSKLFIDRLASSVIGIRDGKQISYGDFSFMFLPYPELKEQEKIAFTLKNLDYNIELLNLELNQLKEQKRGLMQLLLTGIVRVEVD